MVKLYRLCFCMQFCRGLTSHMQITPDPAQEINLALDKLRHKTQVCIRFLSKFPNAFKKQDLYYLLWIYVSVEKMLNCF